MRTTWSEDCDRAVARAQCGQRGEPACLQLGCRRCAQIITTQFEYGVLVNTIGERNALKVAVEEIGRLRAHIGRMPPDVEVVLCDYCGGNEHLTESPAGERCREEQETDRAASLADAISDEARDRAAGL
jgi:hypothetical protein